MLMQSTKARLFLKNIHVEVISHLSLKMCISTDDHVGSNIYLYQSHIAIFA